MRRVLCFEAGGGLLRVFLERREECERRGDAEALEGARVRQAVSGTDVVKSEGRVRAPEIDLKR